MAVVGLTPMNRAHGILLVLALLTTGLAGCIGAPTDELVPEESSDDIRAESRGGSLGARGTVEQDAALCDVGAVGAAVAWCATRTSTLAGTVVDLTVLDTRLASFNGDVLVQRGDGAAWSLVTVMTARGNSEADALANLDRITYTWDTEDAGETFLEAKAEVKDSQQKSEARLGATMRLIMPSDLDLALAASTANGDVVHAEGPARSLFLTTANGDIDATADVRFASLTTSNGDITATLTPVANGALAFTTANGAIEVALPETPQIGYHAHGSTANGEVDIRLKDGQLSDCPQGSQYYTPPCNDRTFTTSGRNGRAVRVDVEAGTSNGSITITPA